MKTKEEIIQALRGSKIVMINTGNPRNAEYIQHAINYIESMPKIHEEISTLNPMKIDEERMKEVYRKIHPMNFYEHSQIKIFIEKYNSTLEDHQVLQPLPKDKPDWFEWSLDTSKYDLWDKLIKEYGTPTKKELVSVEKLDEEICALHRVIMPATSKLIAQHLVNKYGLNPPKREWWMDLKYGEWYKDHGNHKSVFSHVALISTNGGISNIQNCTPYIEPSIHDKVKEKLGNELYEEFMKEVKGA